MLPVLELEIGDPYELLADDPEENEVLVDKEPDEEDPEKEDPEDDDPEDE